MTKGKGKARREALPMNMLNPDPLASTARAGRRQRPAPARPETRKAAPPPTRRVMPVHALGPRGYTAGGRRPAPDLVDVPPVKVTAYLAPAQLERLRAEVIGRQKQGRRSDVSMLLREAIDHAFPSSG